MGNVIQHPDTGNQATVSRRLRLPSPIRAMARVAIRRKPRLAITRPINQPSRTLDIRHSSRGTVSCLRSNRPHSRLGGVAAGSPRCRMRI
jgi:hypothetical protein